jgi:hypothetical protein
MLKKVKRNFLFVSLSLIITFVLLTSLNPARAETIEQDIFTFGPISFVPLFIGQDYTIALTGSGAFGFHTVLVVSYGNPTSSIKIQNMSDGVGAWNVSIVGSGGRHWFDTASGVWPYNGNSAQIDVNSALSFSVGTASYFIGVPPTDGYPVRYQVKVGQ